jgi:GAF domain-containing protein
MARPSRTGGKTISVKARKASSATGRDPKTKRRIAPSASRSKRSSVSSLGKELKEAREQQAATAEILRVISRSPADVRPVFDSIVLAAVRLLHCERSFFLRCDRTTYSPMSIATLENGLVDVDSTRRLPIDPAKNFPSRSIVEKKTLYLPDISLMDLPRHERRVYETYGNKSGLFVPLVRGEQCSGILVFAGERANMFGEREIALAESFREQALIAIENARLFQEVQARTRDLEEALQQQTATADVLKVISRSAFNLQSVLDTLVESATRLCQADQAWIFQRDGDLFRFVASFGLAADTQARVRSFFKPLEVRAERGSVVGRAALEGRTVHVPDVLQDPEYTWRSAQEIGGYRAAVGVPLLREGEVIGVIFVAKNMPEPFASRQIDLVTTFADQAVIAIQNVRLFDEVQAKTRDLEESLQQQTATADVLKAISRSAFDLETVLNALVETAAKLCEADQGTIARQHGDAFIRVASWGFSDEFNEMVRKVPVKEERSSASGRALLERRTIHIADIDRDSEYTFADAKKLGGFKTIVAVPMLREGVPIGVLALTRIEKKPFTPKQIELVETFSDQAAIAIENVRLFEQVQARTHELTKSLEELRATQDRLVQTQKLALLGQLTAGIAHEIKNPLNFVNNFSGISAELIDELREALKGVSLDDKARAEIEELADTLKGNFDKVVHHGRRADAIVKNMLQHSREGSGEHRMIDINALVEESLNLAWHGARAETQGFEIKLKQSFDPSAGGADVFPQDIRRALLNLITNGFYATKRKAEATDGDYEPTLTASTKNLGDRVEIRIRDNGTGITPAVKEKMFEPFFTTKPTGEGTGLGLSISHDIIVKQHAGTIEVETQPGAFTEIRIFLSRTPAFV